MDGRSAARFAVVVMPRVYQTHLSIRCDKPGCRAREDAEATGPSGQRALSAALTDLRWSGWTMTNRRTLCPEHSAAVPAESQADPPPAEWSDRRPHTCDICGRQGNWTDGWAHYGSIRIEESCGCLIKTCSPQCRDSAQARDLIADFETRHKYKRKGCR